MLDEGSDQSESQPDLVALTADIVSAYVSNNRVPPAEMAGLLSSVHAAVAGLGSPSAVVEPNSAKATPAQIRKSIKPDGLISFIDGKSYKTLKRHLTKNGMTIEDYRERYGLPRDYPSVAASYSESRSALAKSLGLGQQHRKPAEPAEKPSKVRKPKGATAAE
ncbi:MucR family transcriptional regulator [Methylobacterium sp. E-046]|nr:MucR family transcriptional regulator [Methylobacterium sp. E-046]MCJ2097688.1 MucR family transcriptional regulator [Methylobacterium sp. E-046]